MSRVSTAGDGVATDAMADYYAEFARGGFGLVVTEGTYFDAAHSQAYPDQPAIVTDEQVRAWARVVDAVHAAGGRSSCSSCTPARSSRPAAPRLAPSAVQPLGRMLRGYGGAGPVPAAARDDRGRDRRGRRRRSRPAPRGARRRLRRRRGPRRQRLPARPVPHALHEPPHRRLRRSTAARGSSSRCCRRSTRPARPGGLRISQLKVNDRHYRWEDPEALFAALAPGRPAYVHVASEGAHWEESSLLAPGRQPDRARAARRSACR